MNGAVRVPWMLQCSIATPRAGQKGTDSAGNAMGLSLRAAMEGFTRSRSREIGLGFGFCRLD
jgi:hypothetical protein